VCIQWSRQWASRYHGNPSTKRKFVLLLIFMAKIKRVSL
jgi:hypothetical protein